MHRHLSEHLKMMSLPGNRKIDVYITVSLLKSLCFVIAIKINHALYLYPFIYIHAMGTSVQTSLSRDTLSLPGAVQASCSHFQFIQKYKWVDLSQLLPLSSKIWNQDCEGERQKGRLRMYILVTSLKKE